MNIRHSATNRGETAQVRIRLLTESQQVFGKGGLLVPAGQLRPGTGTTPVVWESLGPDSRFAVTLTSGGWPLPAGWYRFRAQFSGDDQGAIVPCLKAQYGAGDCALERIGLGEPNAGAGIDAVVLFKHPVHGLLLEPAGRRARFTLRRVTLKRLCRLSALVRMLNGIRRHAGTRRAASVLISYLSGLRDLGFSVSTARLAERYRADVLENQVSYASWVRRYDTFTALDRSDFAVRALSFGDGPLISILVPVYDTPEPFLIRCIESVLDQAYPNWELCLANDASPSTHVRRLLDEYGGRDPRIKVVHRKQNGHISEASNSALMLATGEFIGLLDHDDELRPNTLLEVAEALNAYPHAGLVYSDEDKIDEYGHRFQPHFKPDWNPELLRGQNYICHFTVLRASLVRAVGGFRRGYEGSQDHDLFLRCTEQLLPGQIIHLPRILYHWRATARSTALHRGAKEYASIAGAKAVSEHLARISADASVEVRPHGNYRVRWNLPSPLPRVSLIIPTRDRADLLRTSVESILSLTSYPSYQVLIVDNRSVEPEALSYLDSLRGRENISVLRYDKPFNYSAINNWAVSHTESEILGLLNNDIEIINSDWLEEMASQAWRPEIGAVGAMLYYPDGRIQHAGVILGIGGVASHAYAGLPRGHSGHGGRAHVCQNLSAVTAACLLVRRKVFDQVGGLDESLRVAFNDIDFCLRLREAGYWNLWTPFAELCHHESASRGAEDSPEKLDRFRGEISIMEKRWGHTLHSDPAYNPNLTINGVDFGLAFPPRLAYRGAGAAGAA